MTTSYIKIFHYNAKQHHIKQPRLSEINPDNFRTGLLALNTREENIGLLNKSYFYTIDNPQRFLPPSAERYEIYLPSEWKDQIYDLSANLQDLFEKCRQTIKSTNVFPFDWQVEEEVEKILKSNYKGYYYSAEPNTVVLFHSISTAKPKGPCIVYDWAGNELEKIENADNQQVNSNTNSQSTINFSSASETFINSWGHSSLEGQKSENAANELEQNNNNKLTP